MFKMASCSSASHSPKPSTAFRSHNIVPAGADYDAKYSVATEFVKRPKLNSTGREIPVTLNTYAVTQFPTAKVFQYDVNIGNGAEKRVVINKVWNSKARRDRTGPRILFDGNKLAWSATQMDDQMSLMIDLDAEEGRPARPGSSRPPNTFRLVIRKTKTLDISIVQQYLDGRVTMSASVLESLSFLDHMLREGPAQNNQLVQVKRSFFNRNGDRMDLGQGVEVFRGVYQSIRLAQGKKLTINIDVAHCTFWKPNSLLSAIIAKMKVSDANTIAKNLVRIGENGSSQLSPFERLLVKNFKKLRVKANYKGCTIPNKEWVFDGFADENAKQRMLDMKDDKGQKTGRQESVYDYFRRKYNVIIQFPQIPLVKFSRKDVFYPLEFLYIVEHQRYLFKLDEVQTANMIKFAVAPPTARKDAIQKGKSWIDWNKDRVNQSFGLRVSENLVVTKARLLPAPGIRFGQNKTEQPGTKGRWDLRGKQFVSNNPQELSAWGVGIFPGRTRIDKGGIDKFVQDFVKQYRGHGGKVNSAPPFITQLPQDPGQAVEQLHQGTGNKFSRRPQLLIFMVQDKNSFHYTRIKKSCDCRYGVVSQVMQAAQVQKGNPQYYSNVLMKVNAKLGGCTSQVVPHPSSGFAKGFLAPTMIIGADVSHASPGSQMPSMAAMAVSFDRHAGRYAAACQTNGRRVEIITETNFRNMLGPLAQQWMSTVAGGKVPTQIYYFRDGVSEGQYQHVMQQEVPHIRAIMTKLGGGRPWDGKLTVVIASKRHHIRAFPEGRDADRNGNPLPGCLIEQDCTHPFEWDFYLYSHIALQGTSRPVHYTILHDEAKHEPNKIQNMIYEHCYQYMRSTTSVSLFPAVYYAHLASNRAAAHMDVHSSEGPQTGPGFKQNVSASSDPPDSETKPLMPMYNANQIQFAMWYI